MILAVYLCTYIMDVSFLNSWILPSGRSRCFRNFALGIVNYENVCISVFTVFNTGTLFSLFIIHHLWKLT